MQSEKIRLLVLTDISSLVAGRGEPDDTQSLVRLLLYANDFDIEGLVATITKGDDNVHPDYIRAIIAEYGKVRANLALHDPRYPTGEYLLSRVKAGLPEHEAVGPGKDSEGSDFIISVLDKPDPRPLWITIWGGPRELAQALWKARHERTADDFAALKSRLRVYAIGDQDPTGPRIRSQNPDLFYICSKLAFRGLYRGGDTSLVSPEWVYSNINHGHGPLGAAYPNYNGGDPWGRVRGIKEGDTPSFLYLIPNGLGDPMHPERGSWGGRFSRRENHYFDAKDAVGQDTSPQATVYRWRSAFQPDFAARLDWCVKPPNQANHPPVPVVQGGLARTIRPGDRVTLSTEGSTDPDGDELRVRWLFYREPSDWKGALEIENADKREASFTAPGVKANTTLHIIMSLTDSGTPPLTRYRRVIVTVEP